MSVASIASLSSVEYTCQMRAVALVQSDSGHPYKPYWPIRLWVRPDIRRLCGRETCGGLNEAPLLQIIDAWQ